MQQQGKLFIVMGPSGAGKTTLVDMVLANYGERCALTMVTPYTTREPRSHEQNGAHFHFISVAEFEKKIAQNYFLEWSNSYQSYYGTGQPDIEAMCAAGKTVILVIDRTGVEQVLQKMPDVPVIYVAPPSIAVLRERLQRRGCNTADSIAFRVQQAEQEVAMESSLPLARFTIVNDDKDVAAQQLATIICGANLE